MAISVPLSVLPRRRRRERVLLADHQGLDAIVMLEVMQPVGKTRVAGRAHYPYGDTVDTCILGTVSSFGGGQV